MSTTTSDNPSTECPQEKLKSDELLEYLEQKYAIEVLVEIGHRSALTPAALYESLTGTKPTLEKRLIEAAKLGLVAHTSDPDNTLFLTEKGETIFRAATEHALVPAYINRRRLEQTVSDREQQVREKIENDYYNSG